MVFKTWTHFCPLLGVRVDKGVLIPQLRSKRSLAKLGLGREFQAQPRSMNTQSPIQMLTFDWNSSKRRVASSRQLEFTEGRKAN